MFGELEMTERLGQTKGPNVLNCIEIRDLRGLDLV